MPPKRFGSVRELPSGSFQARYRPASGLQVVSTFDTSEDAHAWLDRLKLAIKAADDDATIDDILDAAKQPSTPEPGR